MTVFPRDLAWRCHVCGRRRPDRRISVFTLTHRVNGVEVKFNARFCNDRRRCREGAAHVAHGWAEMAGV